jgi:hypothetical protein
MAFATKREAEPHVYEEVTRAQHFHVCGISDLKKRDRG